MASSCLNNSLLIFCPEDLLLSYYLEANGYLALSIPEAVLERFDLLEFNFIHEKRTLVSVTAVIIII